MLEHAAANAVDGFVVVGDIVGGADSQARRECVAALCCPVLRGNHEGYVARFSHPDAPSNWRSEQFAPVAWAVRQLGNVVCQTLDALPFSFILPEVPAALFVHASLRSDRDNLDAYTPESTLSEMLPELRARYGVRGHDHHAAVRVWGGRQLVMNGSVGIPLGGVSEAQYLILTVAEEGVAPTFYTVPYDVEGALERFHKNATSPRRGRWHVFFTARLRPRALSSFPLCTATRATRRAGD